MHFAQIDQKLFALRLSIGPASSVTCCHFKIDRAPLKNVYYDEGIGPFPLSIDRQFQPSHARYFI